MARRIDRVTIYGGERLLPQGDTVVAGNKANAGHELTAEPEMSWLYIEPRRLIFNLRSGSGGRRVQSQCSVTVQLQISRRACPQGGPRLLGKAVGAVRLHRCRAAGTLVVLTLTLQLVWITL